MEGLAIPIVATAIVVFALVSARLEAGVVTAPMVFTALGYLLGAGLLGLGSHKDEAAFIHVIAQITLVLVLFADASRIDLALLRRQHDLPVRMLGLGMPLTIAAGMGIGVLLFGELGLVGAAVLATMLAPTDAALGQAVVSGERLPVRIRQALNVESGLNDGIALPVLLIFVSLAGAAGDASAPTSLLKFTALQVTLGPLVGIAVGVAGGWLLQRSERAGWVTGPFLRLAALALAILCFALAELVHGNGFIAAFVGGLAFGNVAKRICPTVHAFAETEGQLLTILTFLIFGAVLLPVGLKHLDWRTALYAALSLTAVRMIPVAISLAGKRLRWQTVAFLGWFGPRGLASILFALLVLGNASFQGRDLVLSVTVIAVLFSIFAHGITAGPLAGWYVRRLAKRGPEACAEEMKPVEPMPVRVRHSG
jgi:NhaP-type Na+/H+ or K+/H+ antiporter